MRRFRHIVWLIAVLAALAVAPAAHAAGGGWRQAIRDCATDGRLHQQYSQSDLQQALSHLPPDINEYTDCYDVLRAALAGPGSGSGSGGLGTPGVGAGAPTTADLQQLGAITHGRAPKVSLGGRRAISPAGVSLASMTASNRLPGPLVWSLIALATAAAAAALATVRRRLPALRRVFRRR